MVQSIEDYHLNVAEDHCILSLAKMKLECSLERCTYQKNTNLRTGFLVKIKIDCLLRKTGASLNYW